MLWRVVEGVGRGERRVVVRREVHGLVPRAVQGSCPPRRFGDRSNRYGGGDEAPISSLKLPGPPQDAPRHRVEGSTAISSESSRATMTVGIRGSAGKGLGGVRIRPEARSVDLNDWHVHPRTTRSSPTKIQTSPGLAHSSVLSPFSIPVIALRRTHPLLRAVS